MFKRTALAVLAALAAVLCCSLSSCKGAGPEQEESVPSYTVEYSTEKVLIDVMWDAQPGDIDDCAENAQLIAVIKILGLVNVYKNGMFGSMNMSVYAGEILYTVKNDAVCKKYVYIVRGGSPECVAPNFPLLYPGEKLLMFLKQYSGGEFSGISEGPLYGNCYVHLPFQDLYVCDYGGKEYILPRTLKKFFPESLKEVPEELAAEINESAGIRRFNGSVYDYKAVIEHIKDTAG